MIPPLTTRRTVLIVDDLEANRTLLERSLASAGYRTICADDGASALAALSGGETVDMVLLDWMMPGLSGLDTLRAIRQTHSQDSLPVIMCTAVGEDDNIVEAIESGANDYVVKPISLPVLRARMATHLRRSRTIATLEHEREASVRRLSEQMRRLMELRAAD